MKNLKNNKGITITDVVIAVVAIIVFAGATATYIYQNYKVALQVQETSNANAYATIIMEKVDEKSFDEVNSDFINLISGELEMDSKYTIKDFSCEDVDDTFKKCSVTISYGEKVFGTKKEITLKKVKIKEAGNM